MQLDRTLLLTVLVAAERPISRRLCSVPAHPCRNQARTNTTPYNIGLDAGTGSGATVATRKLTSGGATVNYTLYSDSGRTTVWGNTVATDTVAGTGNGTGQSYTVYGRIPTQTTPAPGNYADTITVTVTY